MSRGTTLAARPVDNPDQLALFANDGTPLGKPAADRFREACKQVAREHGGDVDPSLVRGLLLVNGELDIPPRQFSALWSTASRKRDRYLVKTDRKVPITGVGSKGNTNKDSWYRRWVGEPL